MTKLEKLEQRESTCAECDKKQSEGWALYCVDCVSEVYKLDPANQRNWVGLTHEERFDLLAAFEEHKHEWHAHAILIDMVEAKLKETNNG